MIYIPDFKPNHEKIKINWVLIAKEKFMKVNGKNHANFFHEVAKICEINDLLNIFPKKKQDWHNENREIV